MLGKGQSGGYLPEMNEPLQSIPATPLDSSEKALQVGIQLPGAVQTGPQQQNQQLLLTPASLQLAQLQAQLTLHRLKLAQGGNTATAASVLNQFLSNVNMSQPLFNQLRTSCMVGNPQGVFPTGAIGFPSSNSTVGPLVGGGFQNPGNVRLSHPCGVGTKGQQGGEYCKKSGTAFPSDTDRRLPFNLSAGTSAAISAASDGQYTNTHPKNMTNNAFQRDFYDQEMSGKPTGFCSSEQKINVYNSTAHKEEWKSHSGLSHGGKVDMVSNPPMVWSAAGQSIRSRKELYNPEEPTSEPKLNSSSGVSSLASSGTQGFGGYQQLHGNEESLSSGSRTLQPYQINDYYAVTPTQLPHQCSICDKKVYNLKDWDQHVKGKLHLQNRTLYSIDSSALASAGAVHYARPTDGNLNSGGTASLVCATGSQDVSTGVNASYLPTTAMKTYSMSGTGFPSHQPESKSFSPKRSTPGRVVHICNLPEGTCTENDVINLGIPFGKVTNYILMRSTHQAFLEMAYVEAAHAMVQYYQLTPATINNQKLLIRMSKRYKELQLKKPGKDVQSIIQDLTSQRGREEIQELEHSYMPERPRSRSPISRSLSPHSHSPSFTSCGSAHSPQGGPTRAPERNSNGLVPHRSSWDWSSHSRRSEEERECNDSWRNGGSVDDDRASARVAEGRRKNYQKHSDHLRDERGGGETMRSSRDWHPRGSPQGSSSYRNMDDDFYLQQVYKSEKLLRPSFNKIDTKFRKRDGSNHHFRSRHSESDANEEPSSRTQEDKRHSSPCRSRSKKNMRRHTAAEKPTKEDETESANCQSEEKLVSPEHSSNLKESAECNNKDAEKVLENGEETDEESWYPKNMEELVTVDEVGEEEDSIVEPDLPELEEFTSCPTESAVEEAKVKHVSASSSSLEVEEEPSDKSEQKSCREEAGQVVLAITEEIGNKASALSPEGQKSNAVTSELLVSDLNDFPTEEFKAALDETCLDESEIRKPPDEATEGQISTSENIKTPFGEEIMETIISGVQPNDAFFKRESEAPSLSLEQQKAISEHTIPLGVEFIVPKMGFFCKLCEQFYTSEDTAKITHCRSSIHYRNLQKYLSQLAEDSFLDALAEPSTAH